MTINAIEIEGLTKRFGSTVALDQLTMTVPTGQVHGFLGPNGAGKSTTIRVLLGLLRAEAGTARLLGGDPWHDAATLHRRLARAGATGVTATPPSLEELFLSHYAAPTPEKVLV